MKESVERRNPAYTFQDLPEEEDRRSMKTLARRSLFAQRWSWARSITAGSSSNANITTIQRPIPLNVHCDAHCFRADVAADISLPQTRRDGCRTYWARKPDLGGYAQIDFEPTGIILPMLMLNHTASYLAAAAAEASARLTGTRPLVTRDEARMSGRFFWYSHGRIAELGYAPLSARRALSEAIAWLILRSYIADSVMGKLKLSPEVVAARASLAKRVPA
jgi:hypothetical protein